jgi:drug/metabolite transporter superfamily protein YnfA
MDARDMAAEHLRPSATDARVEDARAESDGFRGLARCFMFWLWLRRGGAPGIAALGLLSLIGFAVALTRVDGAFAGMAYAAHGGIYIAASLV